MIFPKAMVGIDAKFTSINHHATFKGKSKDSFTHEQAAFEKGLHQPKGYEKFFLFIVNDAKLSPDKKREAVVNDTSIIVAQDCWQRVFGPLASSLLPECASKEPVQSKEENKRKRKRKSKTEAKERHNQSSAATNLGAGKEESNKGKKKKKKKKGKKRIKERD